MRSGLRGMPLLLAGVGLLGVLGCGMVEPPTCAVQGKVEFAGGDVKQLAGGHVEAVLVGDPRVQASGESQEDGRFSLETIYAGKVLSGAREGEYQARILLSDEDSGSWRRRGPWPAPRFARFKTSGLLFQVPASGEVILRVSPR